MYAFIVVHVYVTAARIGCPCEKVQELEEVLYSEGAALQGENDYHDHNREGH